MGPAEPRTTQNRAGRARGPGYPGKGSCRNELSLHLMSTPSAELEDRLDAARVGLFHLRLQLCTETVLVYAQQKRTEMEKL